MTNRVINRAFDYGSPETIVNPIEICLRFTRKKRSSLDEEKLEIRF